MKPEGSLIIRENITLAPLTTLGIGGPARFFAEARSAGEVIDAIDFARARSVELFVLGEGSNIVIADAGFNGLVLRMAIPGICTVEDEKLVDTNEDEIVLEVGAGENWDRFVGYCVDQALYGVECLSGIPGLVGAVPVQNVGAYGQEVSQTIVSAKAIDRGTGEPNIFRNSECGFAYRTSVFNTHLRDRFVITSVNFGLQRFGVPNISYRDLQAKCGETLPSLAEVRRMVLEIRASKSMVIDPADPNSLSVGSFFKNPILDEKDLSALQNVSCDGSVPHYVLPDGKLKIPAAWLIENAGFRKGHSRGNVGISSNHSLAIINRGGATAAEIIDLKREIQEAVNEKFGITLEPEPTFIGFAD
ncbi:MAG TPA: UDP-N-acetylmuramate dehydrogenase [Pyrinomonadaceae bacterium]|nr:UDP-N-acetylmuramate dehydrogenase [Pyrinomonadaceae bacterium]